ncbi:MAG: hypothetical protein WED83_09370 [Acidimicrobiia bacterium]
MKAEAPGSGRDARPPHRHAAGLPGASVRPTARVRPVVPVRLESSRATFRPTDPYVRRFWVAAIGSAAVAELLRLVRAAEKGEGVRLPRYLPSLIRTGLVKAESGGLVVLDHVPQVPKSLRWRFPPSLAADHNRWLGLSSHREPGHQDQGDHLTDDEGHRDPNVRLTTEEQ